MPTLAEHCDWRIQTWRHARAARAVLATAPLPRDDGVVIASMVGRRSVLPYLVAIKTFHRALGRGRMLVVDDGTLRPRDRSLIARHCGDPAMLRIDAIDTGACPRGGTWERLLALLDQRRSDYVVQIDSDTITHGAVPEVAAAIAARRSFTLRGEADAALAPAVGFACGRQDPAAAQHVQRAAERVIDRVRLPDGGAPRYVRGCSGFAGFARSGTGRLLAEQLSDAMVRMLGAERWRRWGSEQVASNFVIANEPDPLLLPYDRYRNHDGTAAAGGACFVHYIGAHRFAGGAYLAATRAAVARLPRG